MTFNEVIQKLGVSRTAIYNYIEKKKLNPKKAFNNRLTFDPKEVQKLYDEKMAVS